MRPAVIAAFAFFVTAPTWAADTCATGGSCDSQEIGDDSFAAAQLRSVSRHQRVSAPKKLRKLGLLQLDGYYWPTQPGDINDLRTWCTVGDVDGDKYKCISPKSEGDDEFGLNIVTIVGGTWNLIQSGNLSKALYESFYRAVEHHLQDDNVHAIMGNAGWFTWYQYPVSRMMHDLVIEYKRRGITLKRKPWLGGSPAMLAAVGSLIKGISNSGKAHFFPIVGWDLLKKPNDRLALIVSNTELLDTAVLVDFLIAIGLPVRRAASLAEVRAALRTSWRVRTMESDQWTKDFLVFMVQMHGLLQGMDAADLRVWVREVAEKIILVPWQGTLGYGIAVTAPGAMFHNVPAFIRGSSAGASQLLGTLFQAAEDGLNVVGIIMESTEMPAYANWVRNVTELPVWDSTVVGKCLMAAAPEYDSTAAQAVGNGPTLFNTPSFNRCMMSWWSPERYELRSGLQKNGDILHYDSLNLTTDQLDKLTCTGGRPVPGKAVGRLMDQFDTGTYGPPKIAASCLSASPCAGRTWQGETCPESVFGGVFSSFSGCFCPGNCPAGYYCGGDEPFNITGLEGIPGGQGYVYGVRGREYSNVA